MIGIDFTHEMLPIARRKSRQAAGESVGEGEPVDAGPAYVNADAMRLPLPDASVDVVSIAFGIRNVTDPAVALAEFHRVLRPGGRAIILEFSLPTNPVLRRLYQCYFRQVLPRTAALIARDRSGAYRYLPQSVNTFLGRDQMTALLTSAGFADVTVRPLTFGIAVIHRGVKPRGE